MSFAERLVSAFDDPARGRTTFFWIGVVDGSFLPVPAEPFVFPIWAAHPRRALCLAAWMLAGCVVGCLAFYALGALADRAVLDPLLRLMGVQGGFDARLDGLRDEAFVTLLIIGFTPIPLQIGTIGAGLVGVDLATFVLAMALSRGARYLLFALAAVWAGQRWRSFFERNFWAVSLAILAVAGLAMLAMRFAGP